jgi:small subunit ribosomal protein S8
MSMTDPVADLLTQIRNAQRVRKESVTLPASQLKVAVVKVLEQEGYVAGVATEGAGTKQTMTITLKYYGDDPVIERLERVSRPGLRIYKSVDELPTVQGGLGISIVSTSAGVMSDRQARAQGRGGEVLCIVY